MEEGEDKFWKRINETEYARDTELNDKFLSQGE